MAPARHCHRTHQARPSAAEWPARTHASHPQEEATRPPGLNSLQQQERFDAFVQEFNTERPHEALGMKCPAEFYTASARPYAGLPDLTYPFHDRDVTVTAYGRLCLHRKRINLSTVVAGQKLGIKEVDEGIWLVSFMQPDFGYFDLAQKTLQPLHNPFGTRLLPMSQVRSVTYLSGSDKRYSGGEGGIRTPDRLAPMPHFECGAFNHSATSPGRKSGAESPRGRAVF
jgi:hypothetical protein